MATESQPRNREAAARAPPRPERSLRAARGAPAVAERAPELRAGADALGAVAARHKMDLEVVAQRRDVDGPMVDRALAIVRRFLVERGLILFGGLAIDYALRLKGGRLYPDDERPDFDVLSPRAVDDAYDLADALAAAGFGAVGAVRAIHVQTMRVRTDFVWVADIGYAPPDVFGRIPTLEYQGMRVVHPDFQRMDQLLAFCFPFNNPPAEDVFHRWRKDLKRFNLFEEHYPIAAGVSPIPVRVANAEIPGTFVGNGPGLKVALHGFAAYAALRASLDQLASAFGATPETDAPSLALEFASASRLAVEAPGGLPVVVVSPDPVSLVAGLPGTRWHDPYMDLVPERASAGDMVVFSTKDRLLGVNVLRAKPFARYDSVPDEAQFLVVTPPYLMLYFLAEAHLAGDAQERETFLAYYHHTAAVIRRAEAIISGAVDSEKAPREELADVLAESPFSPSVKTMGATNNNAAYQIVMARWAQTLRDTPPAILGLDPDLSSLLAGLPQNYYPGTTKQRPGPYDYTQNALFRRSGQPKP